MSNLSQYFPSYEHPAYTLGYGLVSWWQMNDTMTAGADLVLDSHGSVDLDENGGGTTVANYSDGTFGQVLDLTGSGASNLKIASADARQLPYNSDFSLCGWVNFDAFTTHRCIAARADNGASTNSQVDWELIWDASLGMIWGAMVGSTLYYCTWSPTLSTATWYFVYAEYSAELNRVGLSFDAGTLVTASVTGDMNTGGDQVKFGRRSFSAYPWDAYLDGKLSRWGLWSRLLTPVERSWLHSPTNPRNYGNILIP